jgi:hypothetical protein
MNRIRFIWGQLQQKMGSRGFPFITKKQMEKLFSDVQFGTFVFHHTPHSAGLKCRKQQYPIKQWPVKQKVSFS